MPSFSAHLSFTTASMRLALLGSRISAYAPMWMDWASDSLPTSMNPLSFSTLRPIAGSTAISPLATRFQTSGVWAVPGGVNRQNVEGFTAA